MSFRNISANNYSFNIETNVKNVCIKGSNAIRCILSSTYNNWDLKDKLFYEGENKELSSRVRITNALISKNLLQN
jgi:Trp operon repressor